MFPSSTKRQFRHFHDVVVQRRLRNVQKSVRHVQSCCFADLNLLLFCCSRCRRRRRCLSSLIVNSGNLVQLICPQSAHWLKLLKCWPLYTALKSIHQNPHCCYNLPACPTSLVHLSWDLICCLNCQLPSLNLVNFLLIQLMKCPFLWLLLQQIFVHCFCPC